MLLIKENSDPNKVWTETPKETQAVILKQLESNGMIVRSTDQEKEFLSNSVQREVDKAYGNWSKEVDSTLTEVAGVPKLPNEKTTEYLKRAIPEKLKKVADLEKELNEIKAKGADGNAVALEYKTQLDQLKKLMGEKEQSWEKEKLTLAEQVFSSGVKSNVDMAFAEIRPILRGDVDPKLMHDVISARMARFFSENKAAAFEGHTIWKDESGKTIVSKRDGKPLSTKEVLEGYFEDLVDKGKKGGGAGSGNGDGKGGDGKGATWKNLNLPAEVKSKTELWTWLKKDMKMDENGKEFNEAFMNLGKDLPTERKN